MHSCFWSAATAKPRPPFRRTSAARSSPSTLSTARCSASVVCTSSARLSTTRRPPWSFAAASARRHRRPVRRDEGGGRGLLRRRCESRDEALELAAKVPRSPGALVEVLTVADGW